MATKSTMTESVSLTVPPAAFFYFAAVAQPGTAQAWNFERNIELVSARISQFKSGPRRSDPRYDAAPFFGVFVCLKGLQSL